MDMDASNVNHERAKLEVDEICKECHKDNWGGMGEAAVSKKTIENTKKVLDLFDERDVPPMIVETVDGQIEFDWYSKDYVVSARINDNDLLLGKTSVKDLSDDYFTSLPLKDIAKEADEIKQKLKNFLKVK